MHEVLQRGALKVQRWQFHMVLINMVNYTVHVSPLRAVTVRGNEFIFDTVKITTRRQVFKTSKCKISIAPKSTQNYHAK